MRALMFRIVLLGVWASVAAAVETYPLARADLAQPEWAYLYLMQWSEKPPARVEALAKGEQEHVWYGEVKLGDEKPLTIAVAMVPGIADLREVALTDGKPAHVAVDTGPLARAKPQGPPAAGSCRIYLDLNGNRSLTDGNPLVLVKQDLEGRGPMLVTPQIKTPVTHKLEDGSEVQHDYGFRLAVEPRAMYMPVLEMMVLQAWSGTIRLGDRDVEVRVSDTNGDAKLTVANLTAGMPDMITLPPEQTQGAPQPEMTPGGGLPLTRYTQYGEALYHIEVREDDAQIKVAPMGVPAGKLLMTATDGAGRPLSVCRASVISDSFCGCVTMSPGGTPLPPGAYRIAVRPFSSTAC